jgi:hypothetical protein
MDPLFLLPQQPAPIFGRTTNFEYKKTLPDSVFNSTAPAGRHVFRWQNQAGEWWVPSQSYLRIRFAFCAVNSDGSGLRPLSTSDGVAPVMNLPPHLFSRMEYYMDGNKLSELQDYVPQIDTMKHRMSKSRAYMTSVGNRACFWEPDFAARQKMVTVNLGSALNPSTLRTGDVPTQRVIMSNGILMDPSGRASLTTGYFGKYSDGKANIGANYDIYGPSVVGVDGKTPVGFLTRQTFFTKVTASFSSAGAYDKKAVDDAIYTQTLTLGRGTDIAPTQQVLLTLHYLKGESKTLVATYIPSLEFYIVHRSDETKVDNTADAAGTRVLAGLPLLPSELFTAFETKFLQEYYGTDNTDVVTDVMVTPLEPSKMVSGAVRHEVCWKPTLGIFDVAHAIPTTRHELHLQIPNDYQQRCLDFGDVSTVPSWLQNRILDARVSSSAPGTTNANKVFLRIESIEYFAAMASGPRADDAKFVLDLREYRMIPQPIPLSQTPNSNTYPFNLAPNSSSVSVAFQSAKAGNGSVSLSKFIVPTALFPRGAETALNRFYVNFANQNRPREENESFVTYGGPNSTVTDGTTRVGTTTQFFTQRYIETMTNTGQLFKPGGCETLEEWFERGAYYNWMWPRDGNDLSTRFHVFVSFHAADALTDTAALSKELLNRGWPDKIDGLNNDINILVFDMIPRAFSLTLRNGAVTHAETTNSMVADGVRRVRVE